MILILISYYFLKNYINDREEEIDLSITSPSDYTVLITGLGHKFEVEKLKKFIEERGRDDNMPAKVVKINLAYKIDEYVLAVRQADECKQKLFKIENFQKDHPNQLPKIKTCCCFSKSFENPKDLKKKLAEAQSVIQKFETESKDPKNTNLLCGKAFVTLDTQAEARLIVKRYGKSFLAIMWSNIISKTVGICCEEKFMYKFEGKTITAELAPEPSDII